MAARIFGTPIVLPANPTAGGHAANKTYVDAGDATREATANKGAANGYCGLDAAGLVPAANMPLVFGTAPSATLVTTSVTPNAANGSILNYSCTTATLAVGVPTNPVDRQVLRVAVKRSTAAQVVVTFNASIVLSTGLTSSAYTVPSGKVLLAAVEYAALISVWVLTAATVSA